MPILGEIIYDTVIAEPGIKFSDASINQDSFFMDKMLLTRGCFTCIQVESET